MYFLHSQKKQKDGERAPNAQRHGSIAGCPG